MAAIAETMRYYQGVQAPTTLTAFKSKNHFTSEDGSPLNVGIAAFYFNNGDLQLGREMHCNEQGAHRACYVSNYGPVPYPPGTPDNGKFYPDPEQAFTELEAVAASGLGSGTPHPFATVAMESLPNAPATTTVAVREADGVTSDLSPIKKCGADYSGNIPPTNADVDTGLDIETGDTIVFSATGLIWAGYCFFGRNSPDGMTWTVQGQDYPLNGAHEDALIGKIGSNGRYFEIGTHSSYQHGDQPGRLFLRTNDNKPGNGSGAFSVTIQIQRDQQVRFYIYDQQDRLIPVAALDREGPKSVPQMCMACHGGSYSAFTHQAVGASFLPFDVFSFKYSEKPGLRLDDQQESFRKLNLLVKNTNPNPINMNLPIQHLIDELYSNQVDVPNTKAVLPKTPSSWAGHDVLYQSFYARYCRTCHSALGPAVDFYSDFQFLSNPPPQGGAGTASGTDVCNGVMPHAQVPYTALAGTKLDFIEARDLIALSFPCLVELYRRYGLAHRRGSQPAKCLLLALLGSAATPDWSPQCAAKRTSGSHFEFMGSCPNYTGGLGIASSRPSFRSRRKI